MDKKNYVFLTGGFGNQLFQIAGALANSSEGIIAIPNKNNARKNSEGQLDIEEFKWNGRIRINPHLRLWQITEKALNYCLRVFAQKNDIEPSNLKDKIIKVAASLIVSLNLRAILRVVPNIGLGYSKIQLNSSKSYFFIGYFQSYRYLTNTQNMAIFKESSLKSEKSYLQEYKLLAKTERPLVVHVRLGDYLQSPDFGVIPSEYYETAIERIWDKNIFGKIWLFSDNPTDAISRIPKALTENVRVIPNFEESTPVTFEVMRNGVGFVIANSTFSWWAASLAHERDVKVIAPWPWFAIGSGPKDLLPPNWITLNPWTQRIG